MLVALVHLSMSPGAQQTTHGEFTQQQSTKSRVPGQEIRGPPFVRGNLTPQTSKNRLRSHRISRLAAREVGASPGAAQGEATCALYDRLLEGGLFGARGEGTARCSGGGLELRLGFGGLPPSRRVELQGASSSFRQAPENSSASSG